MAFEGHMEAILRTLGFGEITRSYIIHHPDHRFSAALRALEAEVYNRAIEDAAKVADAVSQHWNGTTGYGQAALQTAENIAKAIRALAKEVG